MFKTLKNFGFGGFWFSGAAAAPFVGRQPPRRLSLARRKGWAFIPVHLFFFQKSKREGRAMWFRERRGL